MRLIKLTTKIINSVIVQIILAIIGLCLLIKFFPDKIANFLGIKTDTGEIMSFIELIIEGIFCILVLKEFKMTRKSFEWTEKDRQEKEIHKKISFILYKIVDNFIEHFLVYGFRLHIDDIQNNKTTINNAITIT